MSRGSLEEQAWNSRGRWVSRKSSRRLFTALRVALIFVESRCCSAHGAAFFLGQIELCALPLTVSQSAGWVKGCARGALPGAVFDGQRRRK